MAEDSNGGAREIGRVGLAAEPAWREADFEAMYVPERVAALVRNALLEAGLGRTDPERPLVDLVMPGASVLLKPNWVLDTNEGTGGETCLYTHPEFVFAAVREVLAAAPGRIVLADAPVQLCEWEGVVAESLRRRVGELAAAQGVPVDFIDLRRTTLRRGRVVDHVRTELRSVERYLLFDLGADSLLEEISTAENRFRVGDYDPDELARTHRPGLHQYLLCREAFEADVVLSLPKLKTHCKVGLTGALKNLVGLNGNKDFLPHHRSGGSERGGDCYPGASRAKEVAELLEEAANRRIGRPGHAVWRHFGRAAKLVARGSRGRMAAAWHGNDTCWRMALDLNRALMYGRSDGSMADVPQRRLYSLTDAIVCGQREGPLRPEPLAVGAATFAASPIAAEIVHAALLGLDADRIALIRESTRAFRWPLAAGAVVPRVHVAGRILTADEVADLYGVRAEPAKGWVGHIERSARHAAARSA